MSQKVVFLTGASSGMGRATVKYLLSKGFRVYASSRDVSKFVDIKDKNFIPLVVDLTSQNSIDSAVKTIIKKDKKIDILVNNAGYGLVSSVEYFTEDEMQEQFNINLFGLLRVSKAVIPCMREQHNGVIINISSFFG